MMDKEDIKEKVRALVEHYNSKKDYFSKASEQDIRLKLIDRLFGLLGWDLNGAENPDEVQREEGIRNKESKKKKADYVFRISGIPKFVVEAKAIKGIDMNNEDFREQGVGYAYNLACSWAVLTNFVITVIYYVDKSDDASIRKIYDISDLENFDKNFEILWLLSKEAVREELLEEEAKKLGIKQQKEKVGKQLFDDLRNWRKKLSDDIKKRYNNKYKSYEIEEIVQKIIDRLIFIRKIEDLELEERRLEQLMRKFSDKSKYYSDLKEVFNYYKNKYNSGLFGEDNEEQECDNLDIENDVIKEVINGMYHPKGRKIEYNFAAIDADVLGNIYEQYLSFILKDTPKKTKLEGGRAHRKKQGIYYTPTYIVDYIVKNTVVEYIKHKEIDDILNTKILDPACGSGSFLIKALSEVCRVIEEKLKKGEKSKEFVSFKDYNGRLILNQKIIILIRCIYGVDLDKRAVEIAQLNLLLKLLDGETAESLAKMGNTKKLLPVLSKNIKNGNSLIDDKNIAGDNAFKWGDKFKDIIQWDNKLDDLKEGYGFDVVIGNPPYISWDEIEKKERIIFEKGKYLNINYKCRPNHKDSQPNIYLFFLVRGNSLVKSYGYLSFIIPQEWLYHNYALDFRNYLLNNTSNIEILQFNPDFKVFKNTNINEIIGTNSLIITLSKKGDKNLVHKYIQETDDNKVKEILRLKAFKKILIKKYKELWNNLWSFVDIEIETIKNKINKLEKIIKFEDDQYFEIRGGFQPPISKVGSFEIGLDEYLRLNDKEKSIVFNLVYDAKNIRRYLLVSEIKKFWIIANDINSEHELKLNYPNIYYILSKKIKNEGKFWWHFPNIRNFELIKNCPIKILSPRTARKPSFCIDNERSVFKGTNTMIISKKINIKFILGILNSRLSDFWYSYFGYDYHGGEAKKYEPDKVKNFSIPIKFAFESEQKQIIALVDKMLFLNKKLNELRDKQTSERKGLEEEIKKIDEQIDQEIYRLYEITKEEQKIIEESLK